MNLFNFKKICCLVITYNPTNILLELISTIKNQVDKIIIVDNNSKPEVIEKLLNFSRNYEPFLIRNKENFGIAKALNQGIIKAKGMGYDWVLTFDQDSIPFNNIVEIISEVYDLYPDKQKIGAIGVNFSNLDSGSYYDISNHTKYCEKDYLITSGCLLSINTCIEMGGFREDFFIDNVDLEYSLRLRKNGKVSLITKEWGMKHKAGNPKKKNYFGFYMISSNHNAFRRYYMARNHIILCKEYLFKFPYFIAKLNYFFILSLIQILFVEDNKKAKLIASFKGIIKGIFYSSKHNRVALK